MWFSTWQVAFLGGSVITNLLANAGDEHLTPGWRRFPGEENGNPLQYSCLENPMGRGAWKTTVHGGHERVGYNLAAKQQHLTDVHCAHHHCSIMSMFLLYGES